MENIESDSAYRDSVAAHYAEHLRYLAEFDTVYVHDSVFIREAGDSVYVFKYRDRYQYRDRAVHDTLHLTDTVVKTQTITRTITKTIQSPPPRGGREGPSRFYKWCTLLFWIILVVIIIVAVFYITKALYLPR